MTTEVKFRRGTDVQHDTFTGAAGEMTVDTDKNRVRIHDGVKAGGFPTPNFDDLQSQAMVHAAASGTNTLTATLDPVPLAYVTGMRVSLKASNNNTSSVTLDLNGLGAKSVKKNAGADELDADDIVATQMFTVEYDGTDFQVTSGTGGVAGGGLVSIQNTALTAVANIDLTGFLPGTYDNYEVWLSNGAPGNDGVQLELETSTDGGSTFDTGSTDYHWNAFSYTNAIQNSQLLGDAEINLIGTDSGGVGNAANENVNLKIRVFKPEDTEYTTFDWSGTRMSIATNLSGIQGSGARASAADVDGIRIHWSAGNFAAQGNAQLLGIKQ